MNLAAVKTTRRTGGLVVMLGEGAGGADAPTPNLARHWEAVRQRRGPTIVAYGPRGKSMLSPGKR
jgi:hypothetical protein